MADRHPDSIPASSPGNAGGPDATPPSVPSSPPSADARVTVQPWPSERRWLRLMLAISIAMLALLAASLGRLGLAPLVVLLACWSFARTLRFLAWLRGSAVRIGPEQLPDLHRRVEELSRRVGLKATPDTYVAQRGGVLNAFALRFFRQSIVVLHTDLLDACGDNTDARDFIIGHELGHHAAQHLAIQGLLGPAMLVPFVWKAYSRAREFTCDRYGMAVVGDRRAALRGLAILSAGRTLGPTLNLEAFVRQRHDVDRPFAKLGTWLSTHPPLSDRIAALDPELASATSPAPAPSSAWHVRPNLGAVALAVLVFVLPLSQLTGGSTAIRNHFRGLGTWSYQMSFWVDQQFPSKPVTVQHEEQAQAKAQVMRDVAMLIVAIERFNKTNGRLPYDAELPAAWQLSFDKTPLPEDPEWEEPYSYSTNGRAYLLRASCEGCSYLSEDGGKWGDWTLALTERSVAAGGNKKGAVETAP